MLANPNNNEMVMNADDFIVSKTDLGGKITYCNEIFMKYAGLSEAKLLGKPHNIIRHPDMPKVVFRLLWDRVKNKEEIFAYVKNLSSDGSYYWVYANVTASLDLNGNIIGYYSVRRKPNPDAIVAISKLYETLIEKEKTGGVNVSYAYLTNLLNEKDISYDEFINSLQHGGS
jgi:PAS domain S-box-containing protein